MMQKRLFYSLILVLVFSFVPVAAEDLVLPYEQVHSVEGEVFLPLRQVAQYGGFSVQYTPKLVTLSRKDKELKLNCTDSTLVADGHQLYLYSEPCVVGNVLYVSEDFVQDHLRLAVKLDNQSVRISKIAENRLVLLNQRETFEDKYLELELQYPRLQGQAELNTVIGEKISQIKADAHKDKEELMANPWSPNAQIAYYLNYLVKRNQGDLLSIVFEDYRYTGGAHGITDKFAYNFNLKTGKKYSLADLFEPGADYKTVINEEIKTQIAENKHMSQYYSFDSIEEDQVFYFTNDAVVICFRQYEIAAYAEGKPEFAIPFSKLERILSPRLKAMLK